jgi:hypothetical protein
MHVPVIISEELTILRVGSVGMYFKRIEMVRDIGNGYRGVSKCIWSSV